MPAGWNVSAVACILCVHFKRTVQSLFCFVFLRIHSLGSSAACCAEPAHLRSVVIFLPLSYKCGNYRHVLNSKFHISMQKYTQKVQHLFKLRKCIALSVRIQSGSDSTPISMLNIVDWKMTASFIVGRAFGGSFPLVTKSLPGWEVWTQPFSVFVDIPLPGKHTGHSREQSKADGQTRESEIWVKWPNHIWGRKKTSVWWLEGR